jgi:hypothetical protein
MYSGFERDFNGNESNYPSTWGFQFYLARFEPFVI